MELYNMSKDECKVVKIFVPVVDNGSPCSSISISKSDIDFILIMHLGAIVHEEVRLMIVDSIFNLIIGDSNG
jgi:hypothetical protein